MPDLRPLTVIVPVLNELGEVVIWVRHVVGVLPGASVVIADGGSRDGTTEAVRTLLQNPGSRAQDVPLTEADITVISAPRGRGSQLRRAAETALAREDCSHLLALHVDTALSEGSGGVIQTAMEDPGFDWGWFDLRLDGPAFAERIIERSATLRARLTGRPTGDQGMLMRRTAYEASGGYGELPIFEDLALVRALRVGGGGRRLPGNVVTSGRRFRAWGHATTVCRQWALRMRWYLGTPAEELAARYRRL